MAEITLKENTIHTPENFDKSYGLKIANESNYKDTLKEL